MSESKNDNMKLWKAVEKTDEAFTRKVSYISKRGGKREFTAINAIYEIKRATEQWGALGQKWRFEHQIVHFNDTELVLLVRLWAPGAEYPVEQYGCADCGESGRHAKNESHKKALTDGMTKCLSLLGFSADIFTGSWDDNKYIEPEKSARSTKSTPKPASTKGAVGNEETRKCPKCGGTMKVHTFANSGKTVWSCRGKKEDGNWCNYKIDYGKGEDAGTSGTLPLDKGELEDVYVEIKRIRGLLGWSKADLQAKADEWGGDLTTLVGAKLVLDKLEREGMVQRIQQANQKKEEVPAEDGFPF